jgi:hypothetical protein
MKRGKRATTGANRWLYAPLTAVLLVWCVYLVYHVSHTGGGSGAEQPQPTKPELEPEPEEPLCPPPVLSVRVALVGNEFMQQLPILGYGGIETAGACVHTRAPPLYQLDPSLTSPHPRS